MKPCRQHRNPPNARSYLRRRGKSTTLIYMSLGCDIIRRIKVQIYRRNEGDIWPWQGNLTFDTKNGIGHKRMRAIARHQRLVGFMSLCVIRWRCMKLRGRHKLPNQGSSYIIYQRPRLIRLQGAIDENDIVRLFSTANYFLSNFLSKRILSRSIHRDRLASVALV